MIQQNIFGGDLGGPIAPKARLGYFYVNYQGTQQRSGASPGTFINSYPGIPDVPIPDRQSAEPNGDRLQGRRGGGPGGLQHC